MKMRGDRIFYGCKWTGALAAGGSTDRVTLAPDPAYAFARFDDLEADPVKAAKGESVAFASTTDAIGNLLR